MARTSKSLHLTLPSLIQCVLSPHKQTVWPNRRQTLASGRAELLIRPSQPDVIAILFFPRDLVMGLHLFFFLSSPPPFFSKLTSLSSRCGFTSYFCLSLITLLVFYAMQGSIFILDNSWVSPHSVGWWRIITVGMPVCLRALVCKWSVPGFFHARLLFGREHKHKVYLWNSISKWMSPIVAHLSEQDCAHNRETSSHYAKLRMCCCVMEKLTSDYS